MGKKMTELNQKPRKMKKAGFHGKRTIVGKHTMRKALLLEVQRGVVSRRLKRLAAVVEEARSEIMLVKQETRRALGQLHLISGESSNIAAAGTGDSLERKLQDLLERCSIKEAEIFTARREIQEKLRQICA